MQGHTLPAKGGCGPCQSCYCHDRNTPNNENMKSKGKSMLGWSELMFPGSAGSISRSVTEILK